MKGNTGVVSALGEASSSTAPRPFLKWAGGKRSLIPQLSPLFPKRFGRYFEPFLGGGAVYMHLLPSEAGLSDINPRLIHCYQAIRDDVGSLIERLARLRSRHSSEHYYECRERLNGGKRLSVVDRAALQIYLNKTCFNGLYRENRRGHFNVPIGRYTNPSVFDPSNLVRVSATLRRATIACQPFETVLDQARTGDFVYLDPPYQPVSETSNFTSYSKGGFSAFDQGRLADFCKELDRRGCFVMQSNSDAQLIKQLYSDFRISRVSARRSINSKARRRGPVPEVVIRNYTND